MIAFAIVGEGLQSSGHRGQPDKNKCGRPNDLLARHTLIEVDALDGWRLEKPLEDGEVPDRDVSVPAALCWVFSTKESSRDKQFRHKPDGREKQRTADLELLVVFAFYLRHAPWPVGRS